MILRLLKASTLYCPLAIVGPIANAIEIGLASKPKTTPIFAQTHQ